MNPYDTPNKTPKDSKYPEEKMKTSKFNFKVGNKYLTEGGRVVECYFVSNGCVGVRPDVDKRELFYVDENTGFSHSGMMNDNIKKQIMNTFDYTKPLKGKSGRSVEILTLNGKNNTIVGYIDPYEQPIVWDRNTGRNKSGMYESFNLVNELSPPTYIPLDADDILPGDIVRRIPTYSEEQSHKWAFIYSVNRTSVYLGNNNNSFTYNELRRCYEISHDQGKTWQKCQKEIKNGYEC